MNQFKDCRLLDALLTGSSLERGCSILLKEIDESTRADVVRMRRIFNIYLIVTDTLLDLVQPSNGIGHSQDIKIQHGHILELLLQIDTNLSSMSIASFHVLSVLYHADTGRANT